MYIFLILNYAVDDVFCQIDVTFCDVMSAVAILLVDVWENAIVFHSKMISNFFRA